MDGWDCIIGFGSLHTKTFDVIKEPIQRVTLSLPLLRILLQKVLHHILSVAHYFLSPFSFSLSNSQQHTFNLDTKKNQHKFSWTQLHQPQIQLQLWNRTTPQLHHMPTHHKLALNSLTQSNASLSLFIWWLCSSLLTQKLPEFSLSYLRLVS